MAVPVDNYLKLKCKYKIHVDTHNIAISGHHGAMQCYSLYSIYMHILLEPIAKLCS